MPLNVAELEKMQFLMVRMLNFGVQANTSCFSKL